MKLLYYLSKIERWLCSHAIIFFLCWSLYLSFQYFSFGPASYVRIHDNGDSNLPARLALHHNLKNSQFGYWNHRAGAGNGSMPAWWSFDKLLFVLFPGWLIYGLIMWLQRFVAGYFTFRLLKDFLHLDTLPSLYAGMAYALFSQNTINGAWTGFMLYDGLTLPGLPFVLWAMSSIELDSPHWSYILAVGLGIIYSINSSFVFALFIIPFMFFWFLAITPMQRSKFWILFLLFVSGWVLCQLPILRANFLNAPLSHRAYWGLNFPPFRGWKSKVPFVFRLIKDNALSLGLAFWGVVAARGRNRQLPLLIYTIIFCLVFILSCPFLITMAYKYLGFLSGFQFDRVYLIIPFLATVAGGVGLHLIGRE